ncbi:MAG: DinB family protein [Isosphaerales bacterium]
MVAFLRDLMAHAEWANAVFFHAWDQSPARDHEELRRRLDHLIGVQQGFLSVLHGEPPGGPPDGPPSTFDDLKTRAQSCHAGLREFAASLEPENAARTVRVPWFPDPPCVITVAEAMVQVAMHSQHHRGQCMTRLKDFGGEPKNVDWIIWLWKQKPQPRWS